MAVTKKPKTAPATSWPGTPDTLHQDGSWIWIPLKSEWRDSTGKPEELVRQRFIRHLCDNFGYSLDQMRQEQRMISGSRSSRADIVIWETSAKAAAGPGVSPVLVIECKSENVEINLRDYYQGESYTRSAGCEFFVATNNRFTAIFKLVPGAPVVKSAPIPLPPMDVQRDLVADFEAALAKIGSLKQEADGTRAQAWTDFETAVYAAEDAGKAADLIAAA